MKKAIDYFEIPKYKGAGIYAIVNWEDFTCYVGSSMNIKQRARNHKTTLNNGKHINKGLQEAKNNNKILRFVVLCKLDSNINKDELLLLEYIYMLGMKHKCFNLYNTIPKEQIGPLTGETIAHHIVCQVLGMAKTSDNIEKSIIDIYGINTGYMRNTKYREWDAKQEMKNS